MKYKKKTKLFINKPGNCQQILVSPTNCTFEKKKEKQKLKQALSLQTAFNAKIPSKQIL